MIGTSIYESHDCEDVARDAALPVSIAAVGPIGPNETIWGERIVRATARPHDAAHAGAGRGDDSQ